MKPTAAPPREIVVSDQQALYLSLLGHDLQSAMSDIVGGLRLIGEGGMDPETALQLERVRAASDGMARMLATMGAGVEVVADGGAALARLLQIAGPGAGELLSRLSTDLARVETDISHGINRSDRATLRSATHVLIALAGTVGAARLQRLAESLDRAAEDARGLVLERIGAVTLTLLRRLRGSVAGAQERHGARP